MSSATSVSAAAAQLLCRLAMKDSVKQQVQRAGASSIIAPRRCKRQCTPGTRAAPLLSVGAAHSLYAAAASVAALSESDGTNTCSDGCAIMVRALEAASSAILAVGSSSRNRWHLTSLLLAAASHAADALRTYFRASEANSPADQSKSSLKTKHLHQDAKGAVPALVAILYTSAGSVEEAILMLTGQRPAFNEAKDTTTAVLVFCVLHICVTVSPRQLLPLRTQLPRAPPCWLMPPVVRQTVLKMCNVSRTLLNVLLWQAPNPGSRGCRCTYRDR